LDEVSYSYENDGGAPCGGARLEPTRCAMGRWHSPLASVAISLALMCGEGQAASLPRIGLLTFFSCRAEDIQDEFGPFLKGLSELGYRRDETFALDCEAAEKSYAKLPNAARELIARDIDVIVTTSQPAGQAAHDVTQTVPIVSVVSGDPVAAGLAASLARPGRNLTGVSYYATELTAKRLEILKEAIPGIATIAALANPDTSYLPFEADTLKAARRLGLDVKIYEAKSPNDIDREIPRMATEGAQAIFILPDLMLANEAGHIARLALEHRLPTMAWAPWYTRAGCLIAYSADYAAMNHRLAFYVDRILKGDSPANLPLEQPTTFLLSINAKTAATLRLSLPQTLLTLADDVVE
jgi:putative tryptophan/tyrosine transport system substrate-binding protein